MSKEKGNNNNDNKYQILHVDFVKYRTNLTAKYLKRKPFSDLDREKVFAFISGTVSKVYVEKGNEVAEGDKLLVLEAMKMRNNITTPIAGKVKKIHVNAGERVSKDQLLVEIEPEE